MSSKPLVVALLCVTLIHCSKKSEENIRIVGVPDSVLVQFSYSLFPEGGWHGYIKQTSMYNSTLAITQQSGSFTARGAKEVIVSVPYISVHGSFSKLFLVELSDQGHKLIDWFHTDCSSYSISDVNNDGIDEIITEYTYKDLENVLNKSSEIFSLAGDSVQVVYQNHSVDSREAYNIENHLAGDTLLKWSECVLDDMNKDSVYEMKEITKYIFIDSVSSGSTRSSEQHNTVALNF